MDRSHMLQNLRTGGPRSAVGPQTAMPTQTRFNGNYAPIANHHSQFGFEGDNIIDLSERMNFMSIANANVGGGVGGGMESNLAARLQQAQHQQQQLMILQQQAQLAALMAANGQGSMLEAQALQMDVMKLQQLQQQQNFQNQMMLQSQLQQVQGRRMSEFQQPSTAGPATTSFGDAATTRSSLANQLRASATGRMKASASDGSMAPSTPTTARMNGDAGNQNRAVSSPLNPLAASFRFTPPLSISTALPASTETSLGTPTSYASTTVISGGTPLGGSGPATPTASTNGNGNGVTSPTSLKSDSAVSWRRGSLTNANPGRVSPPTSSGGVKIRPSPLRFGNGNSGNGSGNGSDEEVASNKSSPTAGSSSTTPPSSAGSHHMHMMKDREEASRKLYEGLGIGRPYGANGMMTGNGNVTVSAPMLNVNVPSIVQTAPTPQSAVIPQMAMMGFKVEPIRQPVGPPCAVEELGSANFASRMRKRVVSGAVGVLVEARERREAMA